MTSTTPSADLILLKTDSLGRAQTSPAQREALLDAFERTSMSGAAFAKLHGINYTTFAHWRQKRRRQRQSAEEKSPAPFFEEVEVRHANRNAGRLNITLPGGASVTVTHPEQFPLVAALLKYLESAC